MRLLLAIVFSALLLAVAPAQSTEAGWALLRNGGHVVLLSHAMTAGTTEPAAFDIENCATQRNLSDRGKQQARKIGALFAARAAPVERVLSSRYCRCLETARLAFESEPEPLAALDAPGTDEPARSVQAKAMLSEISLFSGSDNLVMVTHAENIRMLAGISPRDGEAVIVAADGDHVRVLGRIAFN